MTTIHNDRGAVRILARNCRIAAVTLSLGLAACDHQPAAAIGADKLIANLEQVRAGVEVRDVHETPIEGLVGVKVGGGNVVYGTPDGRYIIAGDLFTVKSNGLVNLIERLRTSDRKALVASLDPATMITFDVAPDSVEFDRISVNSEQMLVQAGFMDKTGYGWCGGWGCWGRSWCGNQCICEKPVPWVMGECRGA